MSRNGGERALRAAQKAHERTAAAQRSERQAWKDALPLGAKVAYEHGNHLRFGTVMMVATDRVKLATESGAEAWIYCTRATAITWPREGEWTDCSFCTKAIRTFEVQRCESCGADGLGNCCIGEGNHPNCEAQP